MNLQSSSTCIACNVRRQKSALANLEILQMGDFNSKFSKIFIEENKWRVSLSPAIFYLKTDIAI